MSRFDHASVCYSLQKRTGTMLGVCEVDVPYFAQNSGHF